jgi:hypothetical protein
MSEANGTLNGKASAVNRVLNVVSPPLGPVSDGRNGHGANGRFMKGNTAARGNPFARRMAKLRSALLEAIDEDKIKALADQLYKQAMGGDVAAAQLLIRYCIGKPAEAVDPDGLDADEWRRLRDMPSVSETAIARIDTVPQSLALQLVRLPQTLEQAHQRFFDKDGSMMAAPMALVEEQKAKRRRRK